MSDRPSRRERNKRVLHERMYECALELIERHGYEATTVDAITDAADVAKGTFFNHFRSKEGLLLEYAARLNREHLEAVDAIRTGDAPAAEKLARVLADLARLATREGRRYEELSRALFARPALWEAGGDEALVERYVGIVEQGIAAGELRPGVSPSALATLLCDVWQATALRWVRDGRDFDLPNALAERLRLLLAGAGVRERLP